MSNTVRWLDTEFGVYPLDGTQWNDVGGVYIFTSIQGNIWHAHYVGVADSFRNRLPTHERALEARRLGATHIHAVVVPQADIRATLEQRLIAACQPPLNTHHR
jgi:excinuclease UvrABC nuclease subunit